MFRRLPIGALVVLKVAPAVVGAGVSGFFVSGSFGSVLITIGLVVVDGVVLMIVVVGLYGVYLDELEVIYELG